MSKKIINLNNNKTNYNIESIKNLLLSSDKINSLIKDKKKTLKNPINYLQNYEFKGVKPTPPKEDIIKPNPAKNPPKVRFSSKTIPEKKTKTIDTYFKKYKTKKYNKYEIKYIVNNLIKLIEKNDFKNINKLLKRLNRNQIVQLLTEYKIIKASTKAPLPLLKNLIFNFILGNIYIIKA